LNSYAIKFPTGNINVDISAVYEINVVIISRFISIINSNIDI
jgi:hypothetical protein